MRLSDADRDLLCERLSRHAAAGRISLEELERRVAQVQAAETREQAAPALADLPPLAPERPGGRRRGRGHGESDAVDPTWRPTAERFRDPDSGRVMRVWTDAAGARHYVADDASG